VEYKIQIFQVLKIIESGLAHAKLWKIKPNGCRILDLFKGFWPFHAL